MGTEESPTGEHHYSASAEDRVDQRIALAMTGSCCEMNWVLVTARSTDHERWDDRMSAKPRKTLHLDRKPHGRARLQWECAISVLPRHGRPDFSPAASRSHLSVRAARNRAWRGEGVRGICVPFFRGIWLGLLIHPSPRNRLYLSTPSTDRRPMAYSGRQSRCIRYARRKTAGPSRSLRC